MLSAAVGKKPPHGVCTPVHLDKFCPCVLPSTQPWHCFCTSQREHLRVSRAYLLARVSAGLSLHTTLAVSCMRQTYDGHHMARSVAQSTG